MIPRALTIAGSDSGGGAGIQADLKTFTVLGVFGTSAITAVTAQNTRGVSGIHPIPASFVHQQIDAVVSDIGVDAVKTGMLVNAEIITAVAAAARAHHFDALVIDPVMVAQSGATLLESEGLETLRRELLPLAALITPNTVEAEALSGQRISSVATMRAAARALIRCGARACLITGGHLEGTHAIDILDDGERQHEFVAPRIMTRHTHGTGCQLSAAIAAYLAQGLTVNAAVERAKEFITIAISHSLAIGHGAGPANPLAWLAQSSRRGAR